MLNILNICDGRAMLGSNVETYREAYYWLDYYRRMYGPGIPFENGEGVYDYEFIIIRQCDDCDVFHVIH